MDPLAEVLTLFQAPVLWSAVVLCAGSGILGVASPRFLATVNSVSKKSFDSNQFFAVLDKTFEADEFFLKHARLFGACSLATAALLYFQFG
jgi:hypothetical protein